MSYTNDPQIVDPGVLPKTKTFGRPKNIGGPVFQTSGKARGTKNVLGQTRRKVKKNAKKA